MIFNGFRLLFRPKHSWAALVGTRDPRRSAASLIAAALTAAVFPAAAVVMGHLGSAILGAESRTTAALRAAVGFAAVAGGAMVFAPALTLLLVSLSESSRGDAAAERAGAVAAGVLWPTWAAGVVLAVPPLLGLGPEIGEVLWAVLATVVAVRLFRGDVRDSLHIRRRWARRFSVKASMTFALLFTLIAVGPAMTVRAMLGAATVIPISLPETDPLPRPPSPNW